MKRLNQLSMLMIILLATMTSSCKKDDNTPSINPIAAPNAQQFQVIRQLALDRITTTKTFDTQLGVQFSTQKGTNIQVHPNTIVDQNNLPIEGSVQLKVADIFDRGTMVATNKALMGINENNDLLPLVTGGQLYTELIHSGTAAKTSFGNFYAVSMPASPTGGIDVDMKLWDGSINSDGNLEWTETLPWGHDAIFSTPNVAVGSYEFHLGKFGWFNVDKFYEYQGNTTAIRVKVPQEYHKNNSSVYMTFHGEPNILAQLGEFQTNGNYFTELYGFSPIGLQATIIFLTESNNKFAYTTKTITISNQMEVVIDKNSIIEIEEAALIQMINNLP